MNLLIDKCAVEVASRVYLLSEEEPPPRDIAGRLLDGRGVCSRLTTCGWRSTNPHFGRFERLAP